jgi:mannose-6-phosphate isomerase-like protein (cupin superfamily)
MQVMSLAPESLVFEEVYNVRARRIFPWGDVAEPDFAGAWIVVEPGTVSAPHAHDEGEVFFIFEGEGDMRVDNEVRRVRAGDTIFIPPGHEHALASPPDRRIVFLSIWALWPQHAQA